MFRWRQSSRRDQLIKITQDDGPGTEEKKLAYAEMTSVEAGLRFKTRAGLTVETTGISLNVESQEVNVHEVVIVEGEFEGNKYLHNLDYAEQL